MIAWKQWLIAYYRFNTRKFLFLFAYFLFYDNSNFIHKQGNFEGLQGNHFLFTQSNRSIINYCLFTFTINILLYWGKVIESVKNVSKYPFFYFSNNLYYSYRYHAIWNIFKYCKVLNHFHTLYCFGNSDNIKYCTFLFVLWCKYVNMWPKHT